MRRLGGVVLFVLLTGCGAAGEPTTVPVAAELPEVTTTTVAPTTTSTTTTTVPVTPTTVRAAPTTVATSRPPATTAPRTAAPLPAVGGGCNPNYAGACIPRGPDVDCGEITAKRFRVVGDDVHQLDADNDGIACES